MPDWTVRAPGAATDQNDQGADQAPPETSFSQTSAAPNEDPMADARDYGIASFARDILAVADNMERALGALDAELREKADAGTKALLDGVELTERELLKVLEKHGVKKFEPLDEKFDPNLHQAMFELPDASRPAGTVARVIQPGYMIGERILRPALVAVAKGGPKGSIESPANDNAGASQEPRGSR